MKRKQLLVLLFFGWLVFFFVLASTQTILNFLTLQNNSAKQAQETAFSFATEAQKDIVQRPDGTWDMSLFNADPAMPYPNVSGPFPLYIVTLDGFIISRTNPIAGFLDTVDQHTMLQFATPQTVHTVTNESWRMLTKQIALQNQQKAVITVAYFQPTDDMLSTIDEKLGRNIDAIIQNIHVKGNGLDTSAIDIRKIDYDVSFEVIDKTGSVVLSNGRVPTYMDSTYVYRQLAHSGLQTLQDGRSHEAFLTLTKPLLKKNGQPGGIIVVGKSVESNTLLIQEFLQTSITFFVISILPVSIIAFIISIFLARLLHIHQEDPLDTIKEITFKNSGQLTIDKKIYYFDAKSIQYTLLKAVFSQPIMHSVERIGEKISPASKKELKKLYDAMIGINKKVDFSLVVYDSLTKSFGIAKQLRSKIS